MTERRPRSLRLQFAATFVAIAIVPILFLAAAAERYGVGLVREGVTERNEQVALAIAAELGHFVASQLVHLKEVGLGVEASAHAAGVEALLAAHVGSNTAIGTLLLLDGRGMVSHVTPFDADLRGIDLSAQPAVREARATGEPTWSSATISMQTGQPVVTLVAPGKATTVVGYLALSALRDMVERTRLAPSGEVAVIDRDGTLIAHRDARLVREQVSMREVELVADALAGREGTAQYDFEGQAWLGSVARVPLTSWVVLVAEPLEHAYARVQRIRQLLAGVFGLAFAGAVVAGVWSARRIVAPIEALSGRARRLAAGEYVAPSPGDGRVFREVHDLGASFDAMAAAVRDREEALARSEHTYRTIVSTPVVGVLRTSFSGDILFSNEAAARLLCAATPESLRGRNVVELYADAGERSRLLEQVMTSGKATNLEVRIAGPAGRVALVNTVRDGDVLTSVIVDVTDLKRAAADRTRLETELFHAQKLEAVGRLAGGVAHDFNNLLTAIVGFGSLLQEAIPDEHPERSNVDGILESAHRAAHLTQSLLAYSRKQVMQARPVDLAEVIRAVERLLRRVIGEDVALTVTLPTTPLAAIADAGQIEQVLLNLCTNARDAMPGGGTLRIEATLVERAPPSAQELGLSDDGGHVQITVSDTGQGMDRDVLERVFEPFFTTKPTGKGTGLGLAIVYGIVRQHGGHVAVESARGRGSTFTIWLPASERVVASAAAPERRIAPRGRETILLAEDEPLVRAVLAKALRKAGYEVLEAADGADAVRTFTACGQRVALCLLDVMMPRMNGREAAEAIARLRPGTPVLLATGYAADVLETRGVASLGAELMPKPIVPGELLKKVRDMIDGGVSGAA